MTFIEGTIRDVVVYPLKKFIDDRGWLAELFRIDEIAEEFHPAMAHISVTKPGITRGPHEHLEQADIFCFLGPSNFRLRLWDNRADSPTFQHMMTLNCGDENPQAVIIPKRVVHAYTNIGKEDGLLINCPNRLFAGKGRREPVDEIRHEDDPNTPFIMD